MSLPYRIAVLGLGLGCFLTGCAGGRSSVPRDGSDLSDAQIRDMLDPDSRLALAREAFGRSVLLEQGGQPQLALEPLQDAAVLDPDDRWLQFAYARKLREFRRSAEALAVARHALSLPGEERAADWELAAGLWLEIGARDSAEAAWRRGLALDPHSRAALLGLAGLAEARADDGGAASFLARLAEELEDNGQPLATRATALWLKAGRLDSALGLARSRWVRQGEPGQGELLARLLASADSAEAASRIYDTLAVRFPQDSLRWAGMAARALLALPDLDPARKRLRALVALDSSESSHLQALGATLFELDSLDASEAIFSRLQARDTALPIAAHYLGMIHQKREEYDSARFWFERALRLDPRMPETWLRRGDLEMRLDSTRAAVDIFRRMVAALPGSVQARWLLSTALTARSEKLLRGRAWENLPSEGEPMATPLREEAVRQLDTVLLVDPGHERARFQRAALLERLGRTDSAIGELRRLVASDSAMHVAANYLAYTLAERGQDLPEALVLVDAALAREPSDAAYLDTRGWILHRLGRDAEALAALDSCLASGGDGVVEFSHRAVVLEALGRSDEARTQWREVLRIAPDHPDALQALEPSPTAPETTP